MTVHGPAQVCQRHDGTVEHPDEDDLAVLVVGIDLGGQFDHSLMHLLLGVEDFLDV